MKVGMCYDNGFQWPLKNLRKIFTYDLCIIGKVISQN